MLLSMLPLLPLPASLRERVLRLVSDGSPLMDAERDFVVRRAEPFIRSGFPKPIDPPRRVYGVRTLTVAASVAAACAILLATGTVLTLDALHHKGGATAAAAATIGPTLPAPVPLASASNRAAPATKHHSGGAKNNPFVTATTLPTPSPWLSLPSNPNPPPSEPPPTHSPSPSPSPQPSPGTITAAPLTVVLSQPPTGGPYSGQFTLTAQGGAVASYSIEDPAPAGDLSISPSSGGPIPNGGSVTVTVTVASATGLAYETDLTVIPGGLTVIIQYPPG
jgi:hypothetical protein